MIIHGNLGKSKKRKVPKAQQEQYNQWLASVESMKTSFSRTKTIRKAVVTPLTQTPYQRETKYYPSLNTGNVAATKASPKVYTGDKVLGIATLHKSNAVPVFNSQEAVDISKMRRG